MSEQILVDYGSVESETARINAQLQSERMAMEESYERIQNRLALLDGAANLAISEKVAAIEERSTATVMLLSNLALFAAKSSQIVEQQDRDIANVFHVNTYGPITK